MKKNLQRLLTFGLNIIQLFWPEKCPACGHKLHQQGEKNTRGMVNKSCPNPDCDWIYQTTASPKNRS